MRVQDLALILTSVLVLLVFIIAASLATFEDDDKALKSYCELVSMWEQDAEQGIESVKRNGHPNYKGLECE
jgi:hypothetical protein